MGERKKELYFIGSNDDPRRFKRDAAGHPHLTWAGEVPESFLDGGPEGFVVFDGEEKRARDGMEEDADYASESDEWWVGDWRPATAADLVELGFLPAPDMEHTVELEPGQNSVTLERSGRGWDRSDYS